MTLKELLAKKKELRSKLLQENLTKESLDKIEIELRSVDLQIGIAEEDERKEREAEERAAGRAPSTGIAETNETAVRGMMFGNVSGNNQTTKRNDDPTETPEYRSAFMAFMQKGEGIPDKLRSATRSGSITGVSDVAVMVPSTLVQEIIRKAESYGEIYQKVRKLNIRGGVKFPVMTLMPEATWWNEGKTSTDSKKVTVKDTIDFTYFGVECKISRNLLVEYTTYESFSSAYVELTVEAVIKAVEKAIVNGDGSIQPKGILKYKTAENTVEMSEPDMESYKIWKRKIFGKMTKSYSKGCFIFAEQTRNAYIDCITDPSGRLVSERVTGVNGQTLRKFDGYDVTTVESTLIPSYTQAAGGDIIGLFVDLSKYALNSNLNLYTDNWEDKDTGEIKTKTMMICDGKMLDTNGLIFIAKKSSSPTV